MARLGIDTSTGQPPAEVAREGLDNIANGPVWIVGGQANIDRVVQRSQVEGRAEAIRTHATPPREALLKS